jgi:hypothetical protein
MSTTLAGIVFVRNGDRLDFCWELAVKSLLPICDQVVVCDSDSDDGSRDRMADWWRTERKLVLCNKPWDAQYGGDFVAQYVNFARSHTHCLWTFCLDADELLHEDSYNEVLNAVHDLKPLRCQRLNFWKDAQHLIPAGHCIGHEVVRLGEKGDWMPTDFPAKESEPIRNKAVPSTVKIMHYGFLRKREAFFAKNREMSRLYIGQVDARIDGAEKEGGNWMMASCMPDWKNNLVEFTGTHPPLVHQWLIDRGYHL